MTDNGQDDATEVHAFQSKKKKKPMSKPTKSKVACVSRNSNCLKKDKFRCSAQTTIQPPCRYKQGTNCVLFPKRKQKLDFDGIY